MPLAARTAFDELRLLYEAHGIWGGGEGREGEVIYRPEDLQ